ncbi:UDP-glucose:sterol glucosyltransferase [hydrothermal vent metagenome]|uniref:UDP-glucose:sterol glucosyltransferase n=1 Tax=hydrothermal vent metagenome TaxID=652676 RepID=A0A3B0UKB3_9ZZZZ
MTGKRIAISTIGTQGDVQPYLALAVALKKRGYQVVVGAPADFEELTKNLGIEFYSVGANIQSFLKQSHFENAMSDNLLISVPALLQQGQKIVEKAARLSWEMAQGADAIILNMNTSFAIDIAEALDIPAIMTALQPLNSTGDFPNVAYDGPDLGRAFNKLSHAATSVQQAYYDFPRNRLRRELMGLPPRKKGGFFTDTHGHKLVTLYAYSPVVSPRPRDWPKTAIVTGYWPLNDQTGWRPSERFREFLAKGEAPIYLGFGSMPFGAQRNTAILRQAVARWGGRVIVARGWGGIDPDDLPPNIYAISRAPHDKLFHYVKAVIHHGGAGTTAAGLYAGKPTFILPQAVDQPYWGRRIHELGCGPEPVRLRKLTPDILARALYDLANNNSYAEAAQNIAEKLAQEDGPAKAILHIERVMNNFKSHAHQQSSFG